jgi:hypothetical protein
MKRSHWILPIFVLQAACQVRALNPLDGPQSQLKNQNGANATNIHVRELSATTAASVRDRILNTDSKKYYHVNYSLSPEGKFAEVCLIPRLRGDPAIVRLVSMTGFPGFLEVAKTTLADGVQDRLESYAFLPPFKTDDGVCANPYLSDHYREILKTSEPGDFWVGIVDHRNCSIHVALASGNTSAGRVTQLQNGVTVAPLGPIDSSVTAHQLLARDLGIPMTNARQGYVEGDASGFTLQYDGMLEINSGENTPYFRLVSRSGFNSYFFSRRPRFNSFYGANPSNALARSLPDEVRNSLVWAFLFRNIALRLDRNEAQAATAGEALSKAQEFVDTYRRKSTP